MSDNIEYPKDPAKGKMIAGLILLGLGVVFLLHQFDFFFFPYWLFGWPMWLIAWGVFIGARSNFRNFAWFVLVFIGVANMLDEALPGYHMSGFIWPMGIIAFGLWLILKRNHTWDQQNWGKKWESKINRHQYRYGNPFEPVITPVTPVDAPPAADPSSSTNTVGNGPSSGSKTPSGDDYLDSVSVFGGVKKTILSKDFKGGEIVNIFGGAELDLTMADIHGRVIIDITQIFGGTKIIIPSNWQVVSDIAAVFASVDDKRIKNTSAANTGDKVLVLKGVSIFAGVDVRSY